MKNASYFILKALFVLKIFKLYLFVLTFWALRKSKNMGVWAVGALNQLFIRGS